MTQLVNAKQMKACDQYTIDTIGIPSMVLMERAALAVFNELMEKEKYDLSQVLIVCGSGNNGGDGLAIARLLHLAGKNVTVYFVGNLTHRTTECQQQYAICDYYEIPILHHLETFLGFTLIIDSFLGIGANGELNETAKNVIDQINHSQLPILAVDVPSGIDASTGTSLGKFVHADTTVTFQFKKTGFTISPGLEACGNLQIVDVGISGDALKL
ncbi:NAD(P)H-hydrate epimerase [Enterococcus canintestini]|uniref:NAD(P)H-hydrate epimerase n=1 Tax=Enterococcus canintestini TaxID=317010 RepID=A0A267HSM1_9ENTE|nr:NAD(P)H-hydrate epimerase [Enterococcus canintestini]PAB01207.1 dehydrogenase [Enterococcus canintestini]